MSDGFCAGMWLGLEGEEDGDGEEEGRGARLRDATPWQADIGASDENVGHRLRRGLESWVPRGARDAGRVVWDAG